jgi:hypothetical protein
MGQIGLGILVGSVLYFNDSVVIREDVIPEFRYVTADELLELDSFIRSSGEVVRETTKSTKNYYPLLQG